MNAIPKSTSTINLKSSLTINWKYILVITLFLAVVAFLATPLGPLGIFWRPSAEIPVSSATVIQKILFLGLNISESLSFGLGVSFLIFGYPIVRAISPASIGLTRAAHFSITWLLLNWWIHDSLHTHVGMELNGLLGIEYGFHLTLMIAGVILAAFFMTLIRQQKALSPSKSSGSSLKS
jgi:hypothetical protein